MRGGEGMGSEIGEGGTASEGGAVLTLLTRAASASSMAGAAAGAPPVPFETAESEVRCAPASLGFQLACEYWLSLPTVVTVSSG